MLWEVRYYQHGVLKSEYINAVSQKAVIDFYVRHSLENPGKCIEVCIPRLVSRWNNPVFRSIHGEFNYFDELDPTPWDTSEPTYNGMSIADLVKERRNVCAVQQVLDLSW